MQRPFVKVNPVVGASSKRFVLFTQTGNFLEEFVNGTPQAGSVVDREQGSTPPTNLDERDPQASHRGGWLSRC
jgi:hypothetical protein